ncbi:hypothetical protein [Pseudonocardia alni]|uniref:hypothetical protein n=1 Tax=Pseudonocardia alni TaxID=33907 RepID=UPI001AD6E5FA|nr:hypothetical protein [Pseudonocardia alni]MBO4240832.1 hypothetical protein [Pseudonocardia alni]
MRRDSALTDELMPFVAWLATQPIPEDTRRSHREVTEAFLLWSRADHGTARGRRRRYEQQLSEGCPARLPAVQDGLDRWEQHRVLVARTAPSGER